MRYVCVCMCVYVCVSVCKCVCMCVCVCMEEYDQIANLLVKELRDCEERDEVCMYACTHAHECSK